MIRRAAYQQVVVVDAYSTTTPPLPTQLLSLSHSQPQLPQQQIHKIPIHLIKRSRAVLVKDLERLAPGVTRVVTDQGTVLYTPDSDDNSSSLPLSPRSPTFSGSASSGGSQAYIPIPEDEEDNSIWFVHSRQASRPGSTEEYSATRTTDHASMMRHGSYGRSSVASFTNKETKSLLVEKEVHRRKEEDEQVEEPHRSSWTAHPPPLQQQQQGQESGQSQAASRTRVQQEEHATNLQTHRRGSQASSQHQPEVIACGNLRCQETAATLAGFAKAVLAALGGDGQGDIVALQIMATKILETASSTTTVQSAFFATPLQSSIFSSSSSPSAFKSAAGMVTPETTPVSTPVISASSRITTSPSPSVLYPRQHQRQPSSSSSTISMVFSPPTTASFQATLSGQYPNPAALTLPSAIMAVESPKKTKKKKSAFLAIFQARGEGDETLGKGQGTGTGAEEGKKAWYKKSSRRLTMPSSTPSGPSSLAQATPASPRSLQATSTSTTARRFSASFGFHLKGASSSSSSSLPPTPPLPRSTYGQAREARSECHRQYAQYPASRRPSARHEPRTAGTGSFLDSVSDESTTEDEEKEEVLQRRGVVPQQQQVQSRERYQTFDSDESTDTEEESEEEEEEDSEYSEEEKEQVEDTRGQQQQRRPWHRWTVQQASSSSSSSPQQQRQRQGPIRSATSSSADQTRQTLEGYEHNFDDAPPPAYQSSVAPPPPPPLASSSSNVITPLSVSGSLARQYSIPPRNHHSPTSSASSAPRARPSPPSIPTRSLSTASFPSMEVMDFSSSSCSSLPLSSLDSGSTSSTSITTSSSLPTLLSLLHSLESHLHPAQRSTAFSKSPSSPERESWRARKPHTVASFAYVLIALEQTGIAPALGAWREARPEGRKTKEEEWLAMTGNAATEQDLARALLVLAQEALSVGEMAWRPEGAEDEDGAIGSWAQWVEQVRAYVV
ncbi:hypothetical protein CPC16_002313 [Podila verticillata]|nr:hypothetical protein CPC16_002313 [Podila verticillata]